MKRRQRRIVSGAHTCKCGAYTLNVTPPHAPVAPNGQHQVIRGQLKRSDHTRPGGELADTFVFNLTAGTSVRFQLSGAFDTYLIVTDPNGTQEVNDDVVSGNTNSEIDYDVSTTGPHLVTVSSYGTGMMGNYILQVDGAQGGVPQRAGRHPTPPPHP